MAKDKKSFVLYVDLIHTVNQLTSEKAGDLFKHILSYVNDEKPETDDIILKIAFEPIKQQLKRDLNKWDGIRKKRSQAGKASANKRKQNSTKLTNVKSVEQIATKSTVNVNDNVNVNVNVNSLKKDKKFDKALIEFKKMRVKIRKPLTERAEKLIMTELQKLAGNNDEKKIQILEQSIINSWASVYPLKASNNKPEVLKGTKGKYDDRQITSLD
jgi:hypothetical protein